MAKFIRSIDDIVGHKSVINYLKPRVSNGHIPRVILFSGAPGLGKTSIAKVLAVEINKCSEDAASKVIDDNVSLDCIKLFNMSDIGDDTDKVVSELQSVAFSSTKKKVVILDEVHGMTKKAQDAILVHLEYLTDGVYVFMCTTEISLLRDSLKSRCLVFNLNSLSFSEGKKVIKNCIQERRLKFNTTEDMILNVIASWSGNEPRRALNLLEQFEVGSVITQEELSAFISTNNVPLVLSLLEYMYGSLTKGIGFVKELILTDDFLSTLIDVLQVGLGHESPMVSYNDARFIDKFFSVNPIENYLRFTVAVNSYSNLSKRVFTAKFVEYQVSIYSKGGTRNLKPDDNLSKSMAMDVRTIGDNPIEVLREASMQSISPFERQLASSSSLDELFSKGDVIVYGSEGD